MKTLAIISFLITINLHAASQKDITKDWKFEEISSGKAIVTTEFSAYGDYNYEGALKLLTN